MRRSLRSSFRATSPLLVWTAEEGDADMPDTTFKNVKPSPVIRWWRQVRQFAWGMWTFDQAFHNPYAESYQHSQRMEQITFLPLSAYGSVPGSYCDPLLYNTKTTSPFRWHVQQNNSDIVGHWYMDFDEIQRIKQWVPKDPEDPFEMIALPPNRKLQWEETVDEHGNRHFRYKYRYEIWGPYGPGEPHQKYPTSSHYFDPQRGGKKEAYGFKQGELLRCNEEEEEVVRRIMEEEDKEWDMIKRTELIQEPVTWPGHVRAEDFFGAVDRAKARFREQIKHGKEPDPSKDPEYDLVKSGEFAEPIDGDRAMWKHLWTSEKKGADKSQQYEQWGNWGFTFEDTEGRPPRHADTEYLDNKKPLPQYDFDSLDIEPQAKQFPPEKK